MLRTVSVVRRRLRHVLLPHDYLNFFLTGNYFMEFGDASGTALMDVRKRTWSRDVINAIDKNGETAMHGAAYKSLRQEFVTIAHIFQRNEKIARLQAARIDGHARVR